MHNRISGVHFVAPLVDHKMRAIFKRAVDKNNANDLPLTLTEGDSLEAMTAADVVVLASGTATLEAALLKRLMVVTYKVSFFTYYLVKWFSHVKRYSLPNNLVGWELVPEFMQHDAVPENLGQAVLDYLSDPEREKSITEVLGEIHTLLRRDANKRAAEAVINFLANLPNKSRIIERGQEIA